MEEKIISDYNRVGIVQEKNKRSDKKVSKITIHGKNTIKHQAKRTANKTSDLVFNDKNDEDINSTELKAGVYMGVNSIKAAKKSLVMTKNGGLKVVRGIKILDKAKKAKIDKNVKHLFTNDIFREMYINNTKKLKSVKYDSSPQISEWKFTSYPQYNRFEERKKLQRSTAAKKQENTIKLAKKCGVELEKGKIKTDEIKNKKAFETVNKDNTKNNAFQSSTTSDRNDTVKKHKNKKDSNGKISNIKQYAKSAAIGKITSGSTSESTVARKTAYYSSVLLKKALVTTINLIITLIGAAGGFLLIPAIVVVLIFSCKDVPPICWLVGDASSVKEINITYEDKMHEFGIKIEGLEPNDSSIITYNIDVNQLRKDALLIFLAVKGTSYDFSEITTADMELYGDILSKMLCCTSNIKSFNEIYDYSLIGQRKIINTVKAGSDASNDVYVQNSCNVHGVTATRTGSRVIKNTCEWYFIPCEVSQYSSLPIGICLQMTDSLGNNYVFMVVAKNEHSENTENDYIYICGDFREENDTNIKTIAYGDLYYFSKSRLHNYNLDDVTYAGILDYINEERNFVYRTPTSLIKEFNINKVDVEEIFGDYYNITEEEFVESKIYIPIKEIFIYQEDLTMYSKFYLNDKEKKKLEELILCRQENEDIYNNYVERLIGNINTQSITNELINAENKEVTSIEQFISDTYIKNGIYLPAKASIMAKFVDDNKMTIDKKNVQNGDLLFYTTDMGTYKDINHVAIKVSGGYLIEENGILKVRKQLYDSIVMYGRIKI